MFNIGDKIVYPMHGAGVIEAIEEKNILGETEKYYIMRLPIGDMKVMIPMNNVEEAGLREVIDEDGVQEVYDILNDKQGKMSNNWNRRYRANTEKIKTGDIFEVAEVVRNLTIRDRKKGLSTGEKKMLSNARQILISELVLAQGLEEEEVDRNIERVITVNDSKERQEQS